VTVIYLILNHTNESDVQPVSRLAKCRRSNAQGLIVKENLDSSALGHPGSIYGFTETLAPHLTNVLNSPNAHCCERLSEGGHAHTLVCPSAKGKLLTLVSVTLAQFEPPKELEEKRKCQYKDQYEDYAAERA
jgi:hypothetical protein